MHPEIGALLARSNRLGSDRRITNYAGGNTSAKVVVRDPIGGELVNVLYVKGSGGDLGTLTLDGLAALDVERLRALEQLHATGTHEDDLVELYDRCRFGTGRSVPSIDTPLHALIDDEHVDHLHPDAVIALAAAVDGERLVAECYGDAVAWLPWQRPGFELGLAVRDLRQARPDAIGVVLGGHGVMTWGATSDDCEERSHRVIADAEAFLAARGNSAPFGAIRDSAARVDDRRRAAAQLAPTVRGLASTDRPMVGHFDDSPAVLEFLGSEAAARLAAQGTSCPDHFLRTKVRPLLLDLPGDAPLADQIERLHQLHAAYREEYQAYYERYADDSTPAMRGADPVIVLLPGLGMWSFGPDPQTARVAGEFYINAINVMRGAESVSSYAPIDEAEKFRIEYWSLEQRKLDLRPPAPPLQGRVALVTGAGSGIGRAIAERLRRDGACVAIADLDRTAADKVAAELDPDAAMALGCDVGDEASVIAAVDETVTRFGGLDIVVNNAGLARSSALGDTTADEFDTLHRVLARGSFLVSREAARVMIEQRIGGDIVYVVSKNALVAGPANIAYGAAKADQLHQVRLLAAELGEHHIRVNGVNPDGVVRGSGIFSGDWLEQRSAAHGVRPDDLGTYYASRTLLGREVLPEHVADAVAMLCGPTLSRTTGLVVPVDGGLAAAFQR